MCTPKPPDESLELPTFFIDRDLGRKAFPEGRRAAGMRVVTIAEHYGIEESETVEDEIWMLEAAGNGWPVFCCDAKHRKRRRPAERAALLDSGLREFILNGRGCRAHCQIGQGTGEVGGVPSRVLVWRRLMADE